MPDMVTQKKNTDTTKRKEMGPQVGREASIWEELGHKSVYGLGLSENT